MRDTVLVDLKNQSFFTPVETQSTTELNAKTPDIVTDTTEYAKTILLAYYSARLAIYIHGYLSVISTVTNVVYHSTALYHNKTITYNCHNNPKLYQTVSFLNHEKQTNIISNNLFFQLG